MPWLIAKYRPVGLFSLKHGEATSTGGKSLIIPTPFAVRTALLDAAIRTEGVGRAGWAFDLIKALDLALKPPDRVAVSGIFVKVLKPERADSAKAQERFFQKTIAFREFVHWQGELGIALGGEADALKAVQPWLAHITYFGKRGGFVQLAAPPELADTLPEGFVPMRGQPITGETPAATPPARFPVGLIQRVDEWGETLTFAKVNVYSQEPIRPHRDRIRFDVVLPYRVTRSGRGFTVYELQ